MSASASRSVLLKRYLSSSSASSRYQGALTALYETNLLLPGPVKQELENVKKLDEALGSPSSALNRIVHVAGTNGKGSVCWKVASALTQSGYSTGLFVSPHTSSFRERMRIDNELISEEQVADMLTTVFDAARRNDIPATFFECVTALAFLHFARSNVDAVVLETGLGGRLDATNIVRPDVCCITSVGIDHVNILGNSIDEIASEKLGIVKQGVPVIVGPTVPHDLAQKRCNELGAPLTRLDSASTCADFDAENTRVAGAVLDAFEACSGIVVSKEGRGLLEHVRPPCRFELLECEADLGGKVSVVLDVAHNEAAMEKLVEKMRAKFRDDSFRIVLSMSADKSIQACIDALCRYENISCVYAANAGHKRSSDSSAIVEALKTARLAPEKIVECDTVSDAVAAARTDAAAEKERVLVCGSIYMMSEARASLGIVEPRDADDINPTSPATTDFVENVIRGA